MVAPICRRSIKYPWREWRRRLTNLRKYGSKKESYRNVRLLLQHSQCGWVKMSSMKDHNCRNLQRWRGNSSWQAQSKRLKVYVQIGLSEQGKVSGTLFIRYKRTKNNKPLNRCRKAEVELLIAPVMGEGGMASSHVKRMRNQSHTGLLPRDYEYEKKTLHLIRCAALGHLNRW